ncbi:hypothetical protein [Kordiimonas aquimaris]|uniref:hypothetical protein n=1 Tax=Kordiimonas aquimaris TaxID=707591 RepID=UPI0021D366B5|nr:hypothetical protein [Kordiimonas aquimaris]
MIRFFFLLLIVFSGTHPSFAAARDFDIRLAHDTARERAAAAQLRRLLDTYNVRPFTFTYSVYIDQEDAPHSHPILTLNDYFINDDASALSTFIHEQFHWFGLVLEPQINAAIQDLKQMYPDMPEKGRGGGQNARETFVHLIVGSQEYQATASLLGPKEARRVIAGKTWYRWIYREVLENEVQLLEVLKKHNLHFETDNS